MATITIRNLSKETVHRIRLLAARNGHSMEEEVRRILDRAAIQHKNTGLGSFINEQFKEIGGVELEIPQRTTARTAPHNK